MRRDTDTKKCTDVFNCIQQIAGSANHDNGYADMLLKHIYVTNTTLIKLSAGTMNITSNWNEKLFCSSECLILIEKNQTLSIKCNEVNNHLNFKVIDISYEIMNKMYSLLFSTAKSEDTLNLNKNINSRMLCSPLRPGMNEAFDNVFYCMKKTDNCECGDCNRCHPESDVSPLDFTLIFLLSAFAANEDGIGILSRAIKSSYREKIFNMISKDPSGSWNLDDMAMKMFMSRSTLKRKLSAEGTSFSEIYLDVRMSKAAKLLRAGEHNISQVSVLCGYNQPSYFITSFRKYFQMTPYTFMKLANH